VSTFRSVIDDLLTHILGESSPLRDCLCSARLTTLSPTITYFLFFNPINMSFSQFRAALSFKKTDNQKPLVPVSSNPQHQPSTARTSAPRRSSITGRSAVQRIGMVSLEHHGGTYAHYPAGSRRASIKPSMSIRRVNRPPRLGIESTHGTVSNESGEISAFYSGFFYDDDEVDGNGPKPFTPHPLQQTVPSRCVHSNNHPLRPPDPVVGELRIVKGHLSSPVSLPV